MHPSIPPPFIRPSIYPSSSTFIIIIIIIIIHLIISVHPSFRPICIQCSFFTFVSSFQCFLSSLLFTFFCARSPRLALSAILCCPFAICSLSLCNDHDPTNAHDFKFSFLVCSFLFFGSFFHDVFFTPFCVCVVQV
ncbi:hypothetical protein BDN70DRAFT_101250 [Pholiota conissans]|uniref:Uncharacterized protein n=1 Tax=Pholiota conissans TaxID=109636 RepID=A0A9P5YXI7_9AGAR|nr:hypothetical protein BDN70DRAFT_101250 [Pholiota conissans]